METQNYANTDRPSPLFHYVLFPLLVLTLIGACVNLYESWGDPSSASIAPRCSWCCSFCVLILLFLCRIFALKRRIGPFARRRICGILP